MLAARSEQAEQAARLALRDARDVEIIAAVLSGESHKAVAARHGISAAHARRITQQAREAQPSRSKPPRSKPPREPKPQQRRALRIVSNEPADPLTAAERLLGPWRDALPDDRIAVNDGDTILWVPIIRSWALTRGFALDPGTRNRYMMRYTRTQHRPHRGRSTTTAEFPAPTPRTIDCIAGTRGSCEDAPQ